MVVGRWLAVLLAGCLLVAAARAERPVRAPGIAVLETWQTEVDVWPLLSVLTEERAVWTLPDVRARLSERRPPTRWACPATASRSAWPNPARS